MVYFICHSIVSSAKHYFDVDSIGAVNYKDNIQFVNGNNIFSGATDEKWL